VPLVTAGRIVLAVGVLSDALCPLLHLSVATRRLREADPVGDGAHQSSHCDEATALEQATLRSAVAESRSDLTANLPMLARAGKLCSARRRLTRRPGSRRARGWWAA
jgi:hypothetical protein